VKRSLIKVKRSAATVKANYRPLINRAREETLMRRLLHRFTVLLLLCGMLQSSYPARALALTPLLPARDGGLALQRVPGWEAVPAILARIKPPTFPARDFKITDYGALADSATDSAASIRKAIAACHAAGGGRVVVPRGTFLTGAIHLQSNVNLHISEGATLKFSADPSKYLPVVLTRFEGTELMNYSPFIYAFEQENIAVTGSGTLDGGASDDNWWAWARRGTGGADAPARADMARLREMGNSGVPVKERVFGQGHYLRPSFIEPYRSRNILIEGVRIINSPFWEIHPTLSSNITVRRVNISSHGPNNDGCDPESARDVLIEDCIFDTGDDCIAIKSGRDDDGRRLHAPSENIIIRNCTMKDGHGGVVIGSEISGDCRNVFIENCRMDSPNLDRALRFKSNALRGGTIENVYMRNVEIGRVAEAVLTIDFLYDTGAKGPHKPALRNVSLERVTSTSSPRVMWVVGFPGAVIEDVRFLNCAFRGVEATEVMQHAGSISFMNVTIEPAKKGRSLNSPQAAP
jgi:polygalacturonase